ncbi:MAG: winged helix-turn-helix domain-containing protein [Nitrososphaerales archaeon]
MYILKSFRRSKYDILFDILELLLKNYKKTHIIYLLNLNHKILEKYLNYMIKKNLIQPLNFERTSFMVTKRGWEALKKWQELKKIIENDEKFIKFDDSSLVIYEI